MNIYKLRTDYGYYMADIMYKGVVDEWLSYLGDTEEGHSGACLMAALTLILVKLDLV